jgi:hypothetical protein
MIDLTSLTDEDMGRWVTYRKEARVNKGRILWWNTKYVFVVYWCDDHWDEYTRYTAVATSPEDLSFNEP